MLSQGCAICHEVSFAPQVSLKFSLTPNAEARASLDQNSIAIDIAHQDCQLLYIDSNDVIYEFDNGTPEKLCVMIEIDDSSRCAFSNMSERVSGSKIVSTLSKE